MLSKTSVDEVFMHHFEKISSASGGFAPDPHRGAAPGPCWRTSVLQTPHCPPLEKILRSPMHGLARVSLPSRRVAPVSRSCVRAATSCALIGSAQCGRLWALETPERKKSGLFMRSSRSLVSVDAVVL